MYLHMSQRRSSIGRAFESSLAEARPAYPHNTRGGPLLARLEAPQPRYSFKRTSVC